MEILLIEGNNLMRHSILGRLAEEGYQVTTALTGTKALQMLDAPRFDTILMDTALPDSRWLLKAARIVLLKIIPEQLR